MRWAIDKGLGVYEPTPMFGPRGRRQPARGEKGQFLPITEDRPLGEGTPSVATKRVGADRILRRLMHDVGEEAWNDSDISLVREFINIVGPERFENVALEIRSQEQLEGKLGRYRMTEEKLPSGAYLEVVRIAKEVVEGKSPLSLA